VRPTRTLFLLLTCDEQHNHFLLKPMSTSAAIAYDRSPFSFFYSRQINNSCSFSRNNVYLVALSRSLIPRWRDNAAAISYRLLFEGAKFATKVHRGSRESSMKKK